MIRKETAPPQDWHQLTGGGLRDQVRTRGHGPLDVAEQRGAAGGEAADLGRRSRHRVLVIHEVLGLEQTCKTYIVSDVSRYWTML